MRFSPAQCRAAIALFCALSIPGIAQADASPPDPPGRPPIADATLPPLATFAPSAHRAMLVDPRTVDFITGGTDDPRVIVHDRYEAELPGANAYLGWASIIVHLDMEASTIDGYVPLTEADARARAAAWAKVSQCLQPEVMQIGGDWFLECTQADLGRRHPSRTERIEGISGGRVFTLKLFYQKDALSQEEVRTFLRTMVLDKAVAARAAEIYLGQLSRGVAPDGLLVNFGRLSRRDPGSYVLRTMRAAHLQSDAKGHAAIGDYAIEYVAPGRFVFGACLPVPADHRGALESGIFTSHGHGDTIVGSERVDTATGDFGEIRHFRSVRKADTGAPPDMVAWSLYRDGVFFVIAAEGDIPVNEAEALSSVLKATDLRCTPIPAGPAALEPRS